MYAQILASSGGEKRKSDTDNRQKFKTHSDVYKHLAAYHSRRTVTQERTRVVPRLIAVSDKSCNYKNKNQQRDNTSEKSRFLADDGKNHIVFALGNKSSLRICSL